MHNRMPSRRRRAPPNSGSGGKTLPAQGPVQQGVPRMPHERDESADQQASNEPSTRRMGKLAHDDVERGVVDTDKGPVLERANEQLRGEGVEPEKGFSPGGPRASRR